MPTQVTPATRVVALADLERMQKAEQELERLRKYTPKKQVPTARIRLSQYHDFEAYLQFFKQNPDGTLVKDEKGFYQTDPDTKILYFNTTDLRDLLDGRKKAVTVTEAKEE